MSTPRYTITPSGFINPPSTGFIAATGTTAKVLMEPLSAAVAVASPPSPDFFGGGTLLDLSISSTDSVAKSMLVYVGDILTTQDGSATGNITLTAQNTLTRATSSPASFLTDGWRVGDQIMLFTAFGTAQVASGIDGIVGTITSVTATAITVSGTPWSAGTNVLTSGSRLVNVGQIMRVPVPANAGNSDTTPQVIAISSTLPSAQLAQEIKLDQATLIIGAMVSAVSALPAVVSASIRAARY